MLAASVAVSVKQRTASACPSVCLSHLFRNVNVLQATIQKQHSTSPHVDISKNNTQLQSCHSLVGSVVVSYFYGWWHTGLSHWFLHQAVLLLESNRVWASTKCHFYNTGPASHSIDSIWTMLFVWRLKLTISHLLCAVLCMTIVHSDIHTTMSSFLIYMLVRFRFCFCVCVCLYLTFCVFWC